FGVDQPWGSRPDRHPEPVKGRSAPTPSESPGGSSVRQEKSQAETGILSRTPRFAGRLVGTTTPRSSREAPWSRLLFLLPDAERREDLIQDRLVDVLSGDFADGMERRADGGRQQV